ncbi:MAG: 2Fe-2S iron-sulfur cluster-binding protein, partial [Pseudomonadota bacterium]
MDQNAHLSLTTFFLNGSPVELEVPPGERLSDTLRGQLGQLEVKVGCNAGDCGACTVLVDGRPVCACLTPTLQLRGQHIETLAGLAADERTSALKDSFQRHQAAQCGICTPGMLVSAVALLRVTPQPSEAEVADALGGVLCRCTGYRKILDAVRLAHVEADNTKTGQVGDPVARIDGLAKVNGTERFGDDVAPQDALALRLIRSPFHHAAFQLGNLEGYRKSNGLDAVITAADVMGQNRFGVIPGFEDQPVFAEGETRFKGEAVAAIVGPPELIRTLDLDAFPVTWSEKPEALHPGSAMDAAPLHPDRGPTNEMCGGRVAKGDAAAALKGGVVKGRPDQAKSERIL